MRSERAAVAPATTPDGGRLLVVDDDPDVRDSLERALRCAGYAVTTAGHGADALDVVARSPASGCPSSARWPKVTAEQSRPSLRPAREP